MRDLTFSFGQLDKAAITSVITKPWEYFAKALTTEPPEMTSKDARGWYIPATFSERHRHSDYFVCRDAITFDFDHVTIDSFGTVVAALQEVAFAIYTTYSHRYDAPRFRCVIPLSRPVSEDEYQAISRKLAARIGIELVARESFVPAQMMYLPARRLGGEFVGQIGPSEKFLDADAILAEYADWTDRASWPHRAEGDDLHAQPAAVTAPDQKPGIVGEFCRRFRVAETIARFELPYVPGRTPGRWTYTRGSVPEGAIEYDDGLKFHSHHDTDPCRGQHNCFDLVRIAKWGHLDKEHLDRGGSAPASPTDWPSYRAMVDFVRQLPEFRPKAADEFRDMRNERESADGADPEGLRSAAGAGGSQELDSAQARVLGHDAQGTVGEAKGPERFLVRAAADFADGPPVDWLVRGLLPRAELAVIYGESGSGKSFFALDLCCAITRGVAWRDRKVLQGPVVYVCAEGAGGFKARLKAYARGHGAEFHQLPAVISDAPNLLEAKDAAALTVAIEKWGKPSVIVIDTLSATTPGGNENSGEDMGLVLSHCRSLSRHTGALVVLIHHSGKDATKGARGWSGLRAAADAEIEISRNGDYRTAAITKQKDGTDGERFAFKLKVIELDPLQDEPQSSCVVEHQDAAPMTPRVHKRIGGKEALVFNTLKTMAPSGTCAIEDLVEGVKKQMVHDASGKDRRREVTIRAINSLVAAQQIFKHGEDRVSLSNLHSGGDWADE